MLDIQSVHLRGSLPCHSYASSSQEQISRISEQVGVSQCL